MVTVEIDLIKDIREHLADLHAYRCDVEYHQAIAFCPCSVAKDYRAVVDIIHAQGERDGTKKEESNL